MNTVEYDISEYLVIPHFFSNLLKLVFLIMLRKYVMRSPEKYYFQLFSLKVFLDLQTLSYHYDDA